MSPRLVRPRLRARLEMEAAGVNLPGICLGGKIVGVEVLEDHRIKAHRSVRVPYGFEIGPWRPASIRPGACHRAPQPSALAVGAFLAIWTVRYGPWDR